MEILSICETNPMNITIDSELFLRYFKFNNRNSRILRAVRKEVTLFKEIKRQFYSQYPIFCRPETELQNIDPHKIDLLFEFTAWMGDLISVCQRHVFSDNEHLFEGVSDQAGHIANLTNQLRSVLVELRVRCLVFSSPHGAHDLRSCPHCGEIWAKIIGCSGGTFCGEKVNRLDTRRITDDDDPENFTGSMATYNFRWDEEPGRGILTIEPTGERRILTQNNSEAKPGKIQMAWNWIWGRKSVMGAGCGRWINWETMAPFNPPEELSENSAVTAADIPSLPKGTELETSWKDYYDQKRETLQVEERLGLSMQENLFTMDQYEDGVIDYNDPSFVD